MVANRTETSAPKLHRYHTNFAPTLEANFMQLSERLWGNPEKIQDLNPGPSDF